MVEMSARMLWELRFLLESFSTFFAFEWFVAGMNAQMILQIAALVEFSSADATN